MKTTIYLVRHAHSTYTKDERNRPLSKEGLDCVPKVTNLLINKDINLIFSSPYNRSIQTIEDLATKLNKEIIINENFKERALGDIGNLASLNAIEQVWANQSFSFPYGESNEIAQKRGVEALKELLNKHKGQHIVVSTHGNLMVLILNHYNPSYQLAFWQQLKMPDIYQLTFKDDELIDVVRVKE